MFRMLSGEDFKFKIQSLDQSISSSRYTLGRRTHCYGSEKASGQVGAEAGGCNSIRRSNNPTAFYPPLGQGRCLSVAEWSQWGKGKTNVATVMKTIVQKESI